MERKLLWVGFGTLVLVVLVAVVFSIVSRSSFNGSVINPPVQAPEIVLTDQTNQQFRLSQSRDRVVLLFFGYTSCPDICPTTTATMKQVMELLGNDAQNVIYVFVTTDPAHDNPEKLHSYLGAFHPSFIGLTGSKVELQPVWEAYGVTVLDEGETHSTRIYLVDLKGDLRLTFPYGMTAQEMADDIRTILQEK